MEKFIVQIVSQLGSPSDVGIPDRKNDKVALQSIANFVFAVSAVVAVISIIIYGIMYSVSAGDPGKVSKAKNGIIYSVVGLLVVWCAFVITNYVAGRFN